VIEINALQMMKRNPTIILWYQCPSFSQFLLDELRATHAFDYEGEVFFEKGRVFLSVKRRRLSFFQLCSFFLRFVFVGQFFSLCRL